MTEVSGATIAALVFVFLAATALLALWLHPRLPSDYRSKETTDIVRLGIGVVATTAALVLGLLISSVKTSFDQVTHDVQGFATELILLDRTLRAYDGSAAAEARALLVRYTERALDETWPNERDAAIVDDVVAGALLDRTETAVLALPPDPHHPGLVDRAATEVHSVVQRRWTLIEESSAAIPPVLLAALVLWLGLIFASFGYNAPRNHLVVAVLLLCAAAVSGALFLILEMDTPFNGLIVVPSASVQEALVHMRR